MAAQIYQALDAATLQDAREGWRRTLRRTRRFAWDDPMEIVEALQEGALLAKRRTPGTYVAQRE
jgi:hypothetical protein